MHSDPTKSALFDVRDNIFSAREFVAGLDESAFRASRLHFYAVTRGLQIISEASRRLPDEILARHPSIPWRDIRVSDNVYRHHYDNVAEARVWDTVQRHLAPLLVVAETELKRLDVS